ncbi:MAG: oligosaccharide flippase family protein [Candidatus Krumholzibacteriia bacterium]
MLNPRRALQDTQFREVLHGAFWAFSLRVVGAAVGFGFNVLLARALGADGAGIYFLALTVMTMAAVVARLGLDNTMLRRVAAAVDRGDQAEAAGVYRTAMGLTLMAGAALAALLIVLAPLLAEHVFRKPGLAPSLRVMALAVPVFALLTLQAEAIKARRQVAAATFLQGVGVPLLGLVALALLFARVGSPVQVAAVYLGATVVTLALGVAVWRGGRRGLLGADGPPAHVAPRTLLATSLPLLSVAVLALITSWAGTLALGMGATAADVGHFGAAQRCAVLTSFILVAVSSIASPRFAALHEQGRTAELRRLVRQSAWLTFGLSSPVLLVLVLMPRTVMGLFGEGFAAGWPLLVILAAGQYVNAFTGTVGHLLMMTGLEKPMRNVTLAVAALTIALNVVLVGPWGGVGAATATAVGVAAQNVAFVFVVRRHLGFWALPLLPGRREA